MPRKKPEGEEQGRGWSYTVGVKGLNRVTVYERWPGGPVSVEWYTPRQRRKSLTTVTGHPVYDHDLAMDIARAMSDAQRKKREALTAHELLGRPMPHTLAELLSAMHAERGTDWKPNTRKGQEHLRKFWLKALGADIELRKVTPALVGERVKAAGAANSWSPRTRQAHLRYIVDAFYYAQRQLKWITEEHNLSAVRMPKVDSESKPYSLDEVQRILEKAPQVELRVAAAAEIAWATGRRSDAIRTLPAEACRVVGDELWIKFPGETDKARKRGEVVLVGEGKRIVEQLLRTPAVQASGKLFPWGDLDSAKKRRGFITSNKLLLWLHEVERLVKVQPIPGRGFHAFKRRFATEAMREDATAASGMSGTRKDTLQNVYVQDDSGPKVRLAQALAVKRRRA